MSQSPHQTHVHVHQAPSNGIGTAGFVVSLVGLVSCGILCPLGLVLSLFGLGKEPRGLAIAGTIIGALGSLWVLVFVLFFGAIMAAVGLGAAAAIDQAQQKQETEQAAESILSIYRTTGSIPDDVTGASAVRAHTKAGAAFGFERENDTIFYITHPGDDGLGGTEDDIRARWNAEVETMFDADTAAP